MWKLTKSLNPCCNGYRSATTGWVTIDEAKNVSILVVMDIGLRPFSENARKLTDKVSILVVMDIGLRHSEGNQFFLVCKSQSLL